MATVRAQAPAGLGGAVHAASHARERSTPTAPSVRGPLLLHSRGQIGCTASLRAAALHAGRTMGTRRLPVTCALPGLKKPSEPPETPAKGSGPSLLKIVSGDIGGTNARLQLWSVDVSKPKADEKDSASDSDDESDSGELLFQKIYPTKEFADFDLVMKQFIKDAETSEVNTACLAVAGPVYGAVCKMTNLGWTIDGPRLEDAFGIERVHVINDFEAVGYGVPHVPDEQIFVVNDQAKYPKAPAAIAGPGTGLGEAMLMWDEGLQSYRVSPTEGGHTDFAPRGWKQRALQAYVEDKEGFCELEHVLCGSGLVTIHSFLRSQRDLGPSVKDEEMDAPAISNAALAGTDPLCVEAVEIFLAILGAECSNLALQTLAKGGVYIAGGITPKLLELVKKGGVRSAFLNERNTKFAPFLATIPLFLVLQETVGLLGAKEYALSRWRSVKGV